MRIAVVHEWLVDWAGSERVVEQILTSFPQADLFVLADFLAPEHRAKIFGKHPRTSFLQRMPFARTRLMHYLPLMPLAIEQFDLSAYDLIISSSHSVAKGVIVGPDQLHLSYVHSPMRYAWDQQHQYLRPPWGSGISGLMLRSLLHYLRIWDARTANGVDAFAANSQYIARRVMKAYRRDARVIYPPVDLERFEVKSQKEDFYLCAGRVMPYKRLDIVVDAFKQMPDRKLVVIGDGPDLKSIRSSASQNVSFLGYQPDAALIEHLRNAKALVFAAEEDFGILPVEAQACGTPVIAFGRGGSLETVRGIDSAAPSGVFFEQQSPEAVAQAVEGFERHVDRFSASSCRASAERFSVQRFRSELESFVAEEVSQWRERTQA